MKLKRIVFPLWQLLPTLLMLSTITFADVSSKHARYEKPGVSDWQMRARVGVALSEGTAEWPLSPSSFAPSSSSSSLLSRQKRQLFDGFRFSDMFRILNSGALENVDNLLRSTRNFDVFQCMERISCEIAAPLRSQERSSNPLRDNGGVLANVDEVAQQMNDAFDATAAEEDAKDETVDDEEEEEKKADDEEETTKDNYRYPPIIQQFVQPGAYQQPFGYPYPFAGSFGQNFSQPFAQPFAHPFAQPFGFPYPPQFYNPMAFRSAQPAAEEPAKASEEKTDHSDSPAHSPAPHSASDDHPAMSLSAHASMPVPTRTAPPHLRQAFPPGHFNNPIRSRFSPRPIPFNRAVPGMMPHQAIPNFAMPQRPPIRSASPPFQRSEAATPSPNQRSGVENDEPEESPSWFAGYRTLVNAAQNQVRSVRRNSGLNNERNLFRRMFGLRRSRRSINSSPLSREQINRRVRRGIMDSISRVVGGKEIVGALDRMMEGSDNSLYPYTRAALMGYTGNTQTCEELYPKCPTSTDQMIYTLNNLRKYFPDGVPFKDRIPIPFRYLLP